MVHTLTFLLFVNLKVSTHAAVTARFKILPEGLQLSELHFIQRNGNLSDWVVTAEPIVIQHLEVQRSLPHFLIWEP